MSVFFTPHTDNAILEVFSNTETHLFPEEVAEDGSVPFYVPKMASIVVVRPNDVFS